MCRYVSVVVEVVTDASRDVVAVARRLDVTVGDEVRDEAELVVVGGSPERTCLASSSTITHSNRNGLAMVF